MSVSPKVRESEMKSGFRDSSETQPPSVSQAWGGCCPWLGHDEGLAVGGGWVVVVTEVEIGKGDEGDGDRGLP